MTSPQPVPSRAVLNALRGLILTTSCSVILLAEERRRRLQIARAAIDNARTLHSLQTSRGPIGLAEGHGTWNGRRAESDDDVLSTASLPRPRTLTRRRGRTQLIGTEDAENPRESHIQPGQPIDRPESHSEPKPSSHAAHLLGNRPDMASIDRSKLASLGLKRPQRLDWKPPPRAVCPDVSYQALYSAVSDTNLMENGDDVVSTEATPDETRPEAGFVDSIEAAQRYLQKTEPGNSDPGPCYDDVIPVLERLLKDLEALNDHEDLHTRLSSLARRIFDRVASFGRPFPETVKHVRLQAMRFLCFVCHSRPEDITATLSSVLPLTNYPMTFLVPCTTALQNSSHRKYLREVLIFLSHQRTSCSWAHGNRVCRLLEWHAKSERAFSQTKQLYLALQEFGLFSDIKVPKDTEYRIRRLMIILAAEAGENDFADAELRKLEQVDPEASMFDLRLQKYIIARKASSGKWDQVLSDVGSLRQKVDSQRPRLQNVLARSTDAFLAQSRNNDESEAFLRTAVTHFNLKLKPRWIYAVADGYARRRQAHLLCSWLQFCSNNGLLIDTTYNRRFLTGWGKYWGFSKGASRRLGENTRGLAANESSSAIPGADPKRCTGPATALRHAVLAQLKCVAPDIQRARSLIRSAHREGYDVTEALTPLLIAQLEQGEDPGGLISDALSLGIRLHDSTYNKAAQALSAQGNHRAAADVCQIAARENGKGQLLYNEYNFANLVFAYTGAAMYKALQAVLSEFTSEVQWWHGSRICKESIKLAMKATAMRTLSESQDIAPHRRALDELDRALVHVKSCRPTVEERRAVSEAYVRLVTTPPGEASGKSHGPIRKEKKKGAEAEQDACRPGAPSPVDDPMLAAARGSM
ncbi:hypothetical protein E4U41_004226 [Claviceps citrina]|nr:hypothetical protein E4U41_004226 [Claviceps citrina]